MLHFGRSRCESISCDWKEVHPSWRAFRKIRRLKGDGDRGRRACLTRSALQHPRSSRFHKLNADRIRSNFSTPQLSDRFIFLRAPEPCGHLPRACLKDKKEAKELQTACN